MGRYYYGNIVGKFWFAIQSSHDPENLCCINRGNPIIYKVCHCECYDEDINEHINDGIHDYDTYCKDCFYSKDEHWNSIIQEESDDTSNLCYEIDEAITNWIAYAEDVPKIKNILNEIDEMIRVHKYIECISYSYQDDFNDDGCEMAITYTEEYKKTDGIIITNTHKDLFELLARWVLGSQIVHYFEKTKNETCEFYGEN